jgi:thiol-disulfide isomerase/thioredoxin
MKNNQELKVILSKVAWCGHCTNFLPVFNKSQKLTKNNKYLKNTNVNFEVYDMEEDLAKFKSNNYEDLLPQINGYPTVIVTSLKNGKRVNAEIINHSSDPLEFINTVGETYNKLVSQSGGYEEEEFYKQKYLKYKFKYTELKEQIGGKCPFITMGKGPLQLIKEGCSLKELYKMNNKIIDDISVLTEEGVRKLKEEFTVEILQKANINAEQLKEIGKTADQLKKDLKFDFKSLKKLGFDIKDFEDLKHLIENVKLKYDRSYFESKDLTQAGYSVKDLLSAYSVNELLSVFSVYQLQNIIPLSVYKSANIDINILKKVYNTSQLKTVYNAKELKPFFTLEELAFYEKSPIQVFSIKELRDAGFTLNDFYGGANPNGFYPPAPFTRSLLLNGFTPNELYIREKVVKSESDIITFKNLKDIISLPNLLASGYKVEDIKQYLDYTYKDFQNNKIYEETFKNFYTEAEKEKPISIRIDNLSDSQDPYFIGQLKDIDKVNFKI